MTAAEEWMREGETKGRVGTLRRLLEIKFGATVREYQSQLDAANDEQLERYTVRILSAQTIEEVFAEPS